MPPDFDGSYHLSKSDHAKRNSAAARTKMRSLENMYASAPINYRHASPSQKRRPLVASSGHSRDSIPSTEGRHHGKKKHRVTGNSASRFHQSDTSLNFEDLQGKRLSKKKPNKMNQKKKSGAPRRDPNGRPSSRQNSSVRPSPSSRGRQPSSSSRGRPPSLRGNDSMNSINLGSSHHSNRSKSLSKPANGQRSQTSFRRSKSLTRTMPTSERSSRPPQKRRSSSRSLSQEQARRHHNKRRRRRWKEVEETPPKSLILIWVVVLGELGFDLGTTIIAFQLFQKKGSCCGKPILVGPLPMSVAIPFIGLICLELAMLVRAIILTLWPSLMQKQSKSEEEKDDRSMFARVCCCFFRWKVKMIMHIINLLVILNPFFGCVLAWMLLYQSDKTEAFIVLGLEAGSILLHFISTWLEGSVKKFWHFLLHLLPLVPFLATVVLMLLYLKQEGVCYSVKKQLFQFQGCELCPNGLPPVNSTCIDEDMNRVPFESSDFFDVSDLQGIASKTSDQDDFCGNQMNLTMYQDYEDIKEYEEAQFCFFEY